MPSLLESHKLDTILKLFRETLRRVYEIGVPNDLNMGINYHHTLISLGYAFDIVRDFPLDTITCINSVGNGLVVDPIHECSVISPKKGLGGIGGSPKSIALSNVFHFLKIQNVML